MGAGLRESQAQIIINVPLGQTLNYGNLPGTSYVFQGAGRINLTGANPAVTGSVTIDGAELLLAGAASRLPNISSLHIKRGGRLRMESSYYYSINERRQLSPNTKIYLDAGDLHIYNVSVARGEKVSAITLSGGASNLVFWPESGDIFYLTVGELISEGTGTLAIYDNYTYGNVWGEGADAAGIVINSIKGLVNGLLPSVVIRTQDYVMGFSWPYTFMGGIKVALIPKPSGALLR